MDKIKDSSKMTGEFFGFIFTNLRKVYTTPDKPKIISTTVNYEQWNDSDQPGIDERISFTMTDGREFKAGMTHNRWEHFEEIKKEEQGL